MALDGSIPGNTIPGSKRAYGSKRWLFTWVNYPKNWMALLAPVFATCDVWIGGYEICPDTGSPHIQGYIEWKMKVRPIGYAGAPREIHWGDKNGKPCSGPREACVIYCTKENRGFEGTLKPVVPKWWKEEVLIPIIIDREILPKWATDYFDKIDRKWPDVKDRTIDWFWSAQKDMYKTQFSKFLNAHHDFVPLDAGGCKRHLLSQVMKSPAPGYVLVAPADNLGICYIALEMIKDMFFAVGFGTDCNGAVHRRMPWVVVVCNTPPDEDAKIDPKRWITHNVDPPKVTAFCYTKEEQKRLDSWGF